MTVVGKINGTVFGFHIEQLTPQLHVNELKRERNSDWLSLCIVGLKPLYLRVLQFP